MIKEEYYTPFKQKSSVIQDYFDNKFIHEYTKYSPVTYFGWAGFPVPKAVYSQDPVLDKVNSQFPIMFAGFVMMGPNRQYHWHTDVERGVTINMLMTHDHTSYSMFGEKDKDADAQNHILTVDYERDMLYLFNTKKPHTIINFEEPRYLFSIKFKSNKLSYDDIYKWKIENNL